MRTSERVPLLFCFKISPLERRYALRVGISTATQIVNTHFSHFEGILKGKYDLLITDVRAKTESYISVHKRVSGELKIYRVVVFCVNSVCSARYAVISTLFIFR
jgi:hypothetical protein